jgi:hydrogenase maturation protein HypF
MTSPALDGRRIEMRGTVQGVGMRPWIYQVAHRQGVTGRVWNHASGVTIDAFGPVASLEAFIAALRSDHPPAAHPDAIATTPIPAERLEGFEIVDSEPGGGRHVSIPADLATCPACLAEIFNPADRRFRYPFTNCTHCGPRFTIAVDVPYDRAQTTMARFAMCADCRREYDDPADRRFHAQPNACPVCGPTLALLTAEGVRVDLMDPIAHVARALAAGSVVALKGIGGFHLACDATSASAVSRLRRRKFREEKPLAIMVRDLAAARRLAILSREERALLQSIERPIVLLERRVGAALADNVAPRNPLVGVMLPYTPLHHLLLADAGIPLVMTSANVSEEPIVYRDDEAVERLRGIADVILVHDRHIVTRCDDSVAMVMAGQPMLLRRSRGFVPHSVRLRTPIDPPVLSCGALLKNTFCLAHGNHAWLGPHIGDLENVETFDAYRDAIDRMERFLGLEPALIAHDLHPDYLSTRYARQRGCPTVAVQHHHAHVVSALAEHAVEGPVLGLAFDGTGYGTDGTAWGGEFLICDETSYRRAATFRAIALPGGDTAIRQPWRIALSLLNDAMGDAAPIHELQLFKPLAETDVEVLRRMLAAELNTPAARGVGRYFDGIGALALARARARYEGQVAFELNMAADPGESHAYDYVLDWSAPIVEIDLRPMVRQVVDDLLRAVPPSIISARFHNTMVAATAFMARQAALDLHGSRPATIVLTGGCFQNARLTSGLVSRLSADFNVLLHHRVPPGDGGIALGQAVIAAAVHRR